MKAPASSTIDLKQKTVLITGANRGVGFATAGQLAERGAHVVLVCRDPKLGEKARTEIAKLAAGSTPTLLVADLSSQADIRRLASDVAAQHDHLDVVVNNAGVMLEHRELTVDGIEKTFATNHLGPFLLTELLLPLVLAAPAGRVVTVSSEAYSRRINFENLQGENRYGFMSAYLRSKLCNVLFTKELARRMDGSSVTAAAVSPGPTRTDFPANVEGVKGALIKQSTRLPMFSTPEKSARTFVYAATSPDVQSGEFYFRSKKWKNKRIALNTDAAQRLWTISEELSSQKSGWDLTASKAV
jgi:NAD(P)-dependent dehydrogenase (short-subunit alcohol dehydrogenase family)